MTTLALPSRIARLEGRGRRHRLPTLNPVELARRTGLELDDWQAQVLGSTARQLLLCCCRQSGKSTITSLLALCEMLYRPPALVLALCPAERQSQELLLKVKQAHRAIGAGGVVRESMSQMVLANGSRIVALPGRDDSTIRGFSKIRLLIVDEAARVGDPLYQSVRPMLAVSGGRLVLLSTPFGRRGFFFHEWENGVGFERTKIIGSQVKHIDQEWLAAEREAVGPWWASQEWDCEFVDSVDSVFRSEDIDAAISDDVAPLFAGPRELTTERIGLAA